MIAIDPGEEERHRRLLSLEARYCGPDAALARAKMLKAMLKRELDAEPERATQELVEEIRADMRARKLKDESAVQSIAPVAARPVAPATEIAPAAAVAPPSKQRHTKWLAAATLGSLIVAGFALMLAKPLALFQRPAEAPLNPSPAVSAHPTEDTSWKGPRLPSRHVNDGIAPGRGLVAVVVMPFSSYGGGDTADAFSDMVTEDLTNHLSHVNVFRVIARQTALSYRGQSIDVAKIRSELGVHYMVEGSASLRDGILRVNAALIDARTQLQVWSVRFERTGEDHHAVLAEILKRIGRELGVSVSAAETARASPDPDVQELVFKGFAAIQASRRQGVDGLRPAKQYFLRALELDPNATRAQIGLGLFHTHMAVQMFAPDPKPHLAQAEEILQSIAIRYPNLSEPHGGMGLVHFARNEIEKAVASFERAIDLNPSDAPSYAQLGRGLVRLGREREGLEHILYAMRLSPRDPVLGYWLAFAGYAELELGNYDSAISYLDRAHGMNPTQPRTLLSLISANMWAGNVQVARQQLTLLQQQHPHLSHERLKKMYGQNKNRKNAAGIIRLLEQETPGARTSIDNAAPLVVAVLPVTPVGEKNEFLASAAEFLTSDLTGLLSRVLGLRVISRQTMRTYQGRNIDIAAIGKELDVRYVLAGDLRLVGDRLRLNVELVDPKSRTQVWSDRFDGSDAGQHEILDEIVARLGRAMQFAVTFTEADRATETDPDARALTHKGWAAHFSAAARGGDADKEAQAYFEQALKLRPEYARAKLGLAASLISSSIRSFSENIEHDLAAGERLLREVAAELPRSYGVYFYTGVAQRARGRLESAVQSFERAIELNPSHAASYAHMGLVLTRLGQAGKALEQIQYAMRLGPKDPTLPLWVIYKGFAELELERDQAAIESFRQARTMNPRNISSYAGLAAALALSGRPKEASQVLADLQKVAPHLSHERILSRFIGPGVKSDLRMVRGLHLALKGDLVP